MMFAERITTLINKCLTLTLTDGSIADADGFVVVVHQENITSKIVNGTEMEYSLVSPKPVPGDLHQLYSLSAYLDNGLCSEKSYKDYTIREYHTTHINYVDLTMNATVFVADMIMDSMFKEFFTLILSHTDIFNTLEDLYIRYTLPFTFNIDPSHSWKGWI